MQWEVAGGCSGHDFVVARQKLPGVVVRVEDRKIQRVERQGDVLRFAGGQFDSLPRYEALVVLVGRRRQGSVDLSDLGTFLRAGVANGEADCPLRIVDREAGVGEVGVGQAVAEGEQRLLVSRVEPLVADLCAFGVLQVERSDFLMTVVGDDLARAGRVRGRSDGADRLRSWRR